MMPSIIMESTMLSSSPRGGILKKRTIGNPDKRTSLCCDNKKSSDGSTSPPYSPRKHVRISELRGLSDTGSLPDLRKADDPAPENSLQFESEPLPEGSDIFRIAMQEMGSDENLLNSNSEDDSSSNSGDETHSHRTTKLFRSKVAAVICAKRFIAPIPTFLREAGVNSAPNSPLVGKHLARNSAIITPDTSAPNSPATPQKSFLNPSTSGIVIPARKGVSTSNSPPSGSPVVSTGGTSSPRIRSNSFGKKQELLSSHVSLSPASSPRLLRRSQLPVSRLH